MAVHLLELQKILRSQGLLISFSGRFTQGIIEELGEAIKKYLESEQKPKNDIYHIFSIFIEQTQNIKNYCASKEENASFEFIANSGIITIGKTDTGNYICSGNLVENSDVDKLVETISGLIDIDKTELKKLYKEKLKKEMSFDSKGAGMGLIDMARKANLPLEYSITKVDGNFSFFTLKAVV